jgi:predicted metalloprotease
MRRLLGAAVIGAGTLLTLVGCTNLLEGKPVSVFDDPFHVAGMPATEGPTGLRADATEPTRTVQDSDGGKADGLALESVSDIEEFWKGAYGEPLKGKFQPVKALISWDSTGYRGGQFCGADTMGVVNAAFCFDDKTIGWDRGGLLQQLRNGFGDMAITMVLAHEYGHAIQHMSQLVDDKTPTLVSEQQADCFSGVYMRWVAEGKSPRFTLSTGDGLNNILAAMISFRDPVLTENDPEMGVDEHGSAFERVSAFQFGFTDGVQACAAIDEQEITQRRGDLPTALQQDQTGELEVTEDSVTSVVEALNTLFSPAHPPHLSFDAQPCPDVRSSPPASYCPASNTIFVDLPELQKMGSPSDSNSNTGLVFGDNTAYSVLTSRYMLALQHERGGLVLDNAEAALRTACLTGVATTKLSEKVTVSNGNTISLTAGDLDEAVSGMLTNGLAAGDVNGESVPSGFSRIDAFRTGVLGDQDRCVKRYP